MVIVDLNQVMIATMMASLGAHKNAPIDEHILRGMILNSLRQNRQRFADCGEMVIACDGRFSWRKAVFPYYKAARKANRDASEIDWHLVFSIFAKVREELKIFFPYRVIEVESAEADDIIGVIVTKFGSDPDAFLLNNFDEKIVIVSGDKDFPQLQRHANVVQWNPVMKKWIKASDPARHLKEHIIRGDVGDGVPNFLSDDDCLVTKTRQKQIREDKLAQWLDLTPEAICDTDVKLRNWKRNEQLIDLRFTPTDVAEKIVAEYESQAGKDRSKLANYFIKYRLKHLHEHLPEF